MEKNFWFVVLVLVSFVFIACSSSKGKDCATEGEGEVTITLNLVDGPVGKEFRVSLFRVEKDSVEYLEGSAQGVFGYGENRIVFSNRKPGTYYIKIAPVEGCEAFDLEMEPVKLAGESLMIDSPCNVIEVSVEFRTRWDCFFEVYKMDCDLNSNLGVTSGTWAWWQMFMGRGLEEGGDRYCIITPNPSIDEDLFHSCLKFFGD